MGKVLKNAGACFEGRALCSHGAYTWERTAAPEAARGSAGARSDAGPSWAGHTVQGGPPPPPTGSPPAHPSRSPESAALHVRAQTWGGRRWDRGAEDGGSVTLSPVTVPAPSGDIPVAFWGESHRDLGAAIKKDSRCRCTFTKEGLKTGAESAEGFPFFLSGIRPRMVAGRSQGLPSTLQALVDAVGATLAEYGDGIPDDPWAAPAGEVGEGFVKIRSDVLGIKAFIRPTKGMVSRLRGGGAASHGTAFTQQGLK
eukprot:gene4942-biopygen10466